MRRGKRGALEPARLSRRQLLQVAGVATVAAVVPRTARAQDTITVPLRSPPRMGSVGIARGQMARVSLFHHMGGQLIPCDGIIELVGLDGKLLASDTVQLTPGQGLFVDYDLAAGFKKGERVQFHPSTSPQWGRGEGEGGQDVMGRSLVEPVLGWRYRLTVIWPSW